MDGEAQQTRRCSLSGMEPSPSAAIGRRGTTLQLTVDPPAGENVSLGRQYCCLIRSHGRLSNCAPLIAHALHCYRLLRSSVPHGIILQLGGHALLARLSLIPHCSDL